MSWFRWPQIWHLLQTRFELERARHALRHRRRFGDRTQQYLVWKAACHAQSCESVPVNPTPTSNTQYLVQVGLDQPTLTCQRAGQQVLRAQLLLDAQHLESAPRHKQHL
jgi:hypothetical protein